MNISGNAKRIELSNPVLKNFNIAFLILLILTLLVYYYVPLNDIRVYEHFWVWRVLEIKNHIVGILFYIPLLYALIFFRWKGFAVIWTIFFLTMLPQIIYWGNNFASIFSNILMLMIPMMLILLVILSIKWIEKEKALLKERQLVQQSLMAEIIKAQEEERKRISQELHDDTIQTIVALTNKLQYLITNYQNQLPDEGFKIIDSVAKTMQAVTKDLRKLCLDLRPSILDDIGLHEAVRSLVDTANTEKTRVQLLVKGKSRRLTSDTEVAVYRFIQEALNNALQHASATEIFICMEFGVNTMKIDIQDNGKGFIIPKSMKQFLSVQKLGLIGMQERAKILLNGKFDIHSSPGKGTTVTLKFKTD